jgi:hypothetical protein
MQANRRAGATRFLGVTVILLAVGTMIDGVAREDILMIALGLLLAATAMQVFRK